MKDSFIIEFTYYEKGKIRTTYAGNILSLPSPFRSFDQARRFKTVDDAKNWLLDSIKLNSDFTFPDRELVSVRFICIQAIVEKDITNNYIFYFLK